MSSSGEGDSINLNKEGESPPATLPEGIPCSPVIGKDESSFPDAAKQNTPLTSTTKADNASIDNFEETSEEIEAVIEKKLPIDKDKALDIDSELDFELKWDDDQNEDQTNDIDLDKESKDAENTVKNDDVKESQGTVTADKDNLDKIDDKTDTSNAAGGIEANNAMDTNNGDDAIESLNKVSDHVPDKLDLELKAEDELLKSDDLDEEDLLNENTEENLLKADRNDVENVSAKENDVKNSQMAVENEVDILNVNTAKATESSSNESETNSLDEHLVYSDVDVPDIEDKDLMNEIEAQINKFENNIETSDIENLEDKSELSDQKETETCINPTTNEKDLGNIVIEPEKTPSDEKVQDIPEIASENENITSEISPSNELADKEKLQVSIVTSQKEKELSAANMNEKETSEKDIVTEMDVDVDVTTSNQPIEKSGINDTSASITDMDTSSYDINKEHGLDRPDVMIEIPTQELIESFDDSDEPSNIAEETSEKVINQTDNEIASKPDLIETVSEAQNLDSMETQKINDKNIANTYSDKEDKVNGTVNETRTEDIKITVASTESTQILEAESMDIDISTSETIEKPEEITCKDNSNVEAVKPIENVFTADKVSHGDIVLEANSEQPKALSSDDVSSTTEIDSDLNKEAKKVEKPQPDVREVEKAKESEPSTSEGHQELSDEDQETTDSLGLLAESSRVMEDDDEPEPEEQPEEDDDDDDFDQDDESNQMTAEHSEDSNAPQSETEVPKDTMDIESNDATVTDSLDAQEAEVAGEADEYCDASEDNDVDINEETNDVDESSTEKSDFQIEIGDVVSGKAIEAEVAGEMDTTEEAAMAVDALLQDQKSEESADVPQVAEMKSINESEPLCDITEDNSTLRRLLMKDIEPATETPEEKKSPSKTKKLEISKTKHEINIVELEESSSEDDIQVVNKQATEPPSSPKDVTSVKIPDEVEVMSTAGGDTSDMTQKPGETVISGIPKPAAHKPARLNTGEVTIKTAGPAAEPLVIPETTAASMTPEAKTPTDLGSEIFSLDSDEDEIVTRSKRKKKLTAVEIDKARETNKCINPNCVSDASVTLVPASVAAAVYFAANAQRGGGLCVNCAKRFEERSEKLIQDVKDMTPYLDMDMCMVREEFVEISDSDSDDEVVKRDDEKIGEKGAKFLEEHLADVFNDTWNKYDMADRFMVAQAEINLQVSELEKECQKIDSMLDECQRVTDKFRNQLYDTFADERKELPPISIYDTATSQWCGLEEGITIPEVKEIRQVKRRPPPAPEPPAKRAAIPLGYTPLDNTAAKQAAPPESKPVPAPAPTPTPVAANTTPSIDMTSQNDDDNADISVVRLSVEAAPAGLPAPGVATRPALRPHMRVYAMRNSFGAWHSVTIVEVQPKVPGQFTMCRVRFEQPKNTLKVLPARCLAYEHAPDVRLTIGTRVIALFKDHRFAGDQKMEAEKKEAYYSGIVAEIPNPVNSYRYLIFFDDGYAQYVQHSVTRLVCECAPRVWDEVHPLSRQFVREYLRAYPERPMVRLHAGQSIKTEWNGKWWVSKVLEVDASLVHVHFEGKKESGIEKTEWIYRGSTRLAPLYLELQAAERQRARPLPRAQAGRRFNMPYVEYTRSDVPADRPAPAPTAEQTRAQIEQEIRRQRAVAKKSTAQPPAPAPARENVTSRVVFYTPKNAIKPFKMVPHTCGPKCKRTDVLALKDLRTYNPLTKPLLSGWERQQVRYRIPAVKAVMYRAPCGRRIRDYKELHQYLQATESDMGVDLFDFNPSTHCLAEFLLNKCLVSKKDLSHGKENVPVPCVNYYDDSLPEFCSYNTERTPTAGVPLNIDPEFLCGCDCTDDCADKTKCACWKMTLEGARTIGMDTDRVGYVYKRLPEPLPSGIYECNVRCKCKQTCLNRVAQHPLQLKLQVFKTANRGWGIRALNDVPKGAFLCVYAGNLLTDATANLDGLNEGDEYLAELDYIEVVEQMKEGFEEDIPEDAKKLDQDEDSSSSMSSSSSEEEPSAQDGDDDFRPMVPAGRYTPSEYSKRLRKRDKSKKGKEKEKKDKDRNTEVCITISDDEELREPARFAAQAGMGGREFVSKYKSVRAHFGKDEACYIMDAKVQGNIGRYLNHSCTPNVFVQNVFVDTHDPRFPWVAFFALSQIRAGTELTWNYNYDVGSVPGKVLYCYCNAPNCRGRLL